MNEIREIPTELLQAYNETEYHVHDETPFTLTIGQTCLSLLHIYAKTNAQSAAFITAYNPFSEQLPPAKNKALNDALEAELKKRSLKFMHGTGQHPSGDWPGEPSFLVFDLDLAAATSLAKRYQQNAFLWCGQDGLVKLITA